MKISQITPTNYSRNYSYSNKNNFTTNNIKFTGISQQTGLRKFVNDTYHKAMDPIENSIAKGFAKLLQRKQAKYIIAKTEEHPKINNDLFSHLLVLGSTLLSGFYVLKTLQNDKLDDKKKKTLAINQTATFVLSTIMAYTFDNIISKKTDRIKKKFVELNPEPVHASKMNDYMKGIDAAKKIMIFATMYRFIAPVIVTPIANAIGNRLHEDKLKKEQ